MTDEDIGTALLAIPVLGLSVLAARFGGWPWLAGVLLVVVGLGWTYCLVHFRRHEGLPVPIETSSTELACVPVVEDVAA